ncbi:MAG: thiamine phosphate synthase [Planctomycetes bacterium]|nr:thiamine phosphate synthase [Planctomycetota bacterium]
MSDVRRIIDANGNRAREAMRVMEEAARFVLDDVKLSKALKQLRHDLAAAVKPIRSLELHRDTPGDVGTSLSTKAEHTRAGIADVVIAAGKRLGESLRCLEEYTKLIDLAVAAAIKQLRYRAYELERQLHIRLGSPLTRQWKVCVILTESLCVHHPWRAVAAAALAGGADCLQLREKSLDTGELLDRAAKLVELAAGRAAVIVNDRLDVALAAGATGVHLGQRDLPLPAARRIAGRQLLLGASTHNLAEARRAIADGADYCGVGAVFPTSTKPRKPSGPSYLAKFVTRYPAVPHLAIGGITPDNIHAVVAAGARGVAVSSIVCAAANPKSVVCKLARALR